MSSRFIKRQLPVLLVFLVGIVITTDWFIIWEPLQNVTKNLLNFQVIMYAAMMYFSMINLYTVHSQRIRRNLKEKKYYDMFTSVLLLFFLTIAVLVGNIYGRNSPAYKFIYDNFRTPLAYAGGIHLTLFIASATYRVIKPKTKETAMFFLAALLTLLSNIPYMTASVPALMVIRTWLTDILVKASYRAITIGLGLGGILLGLRILLGIESSYLGTEE